MKKMTSPLSREPQAAFGSAILAVLIPGVIFCRCMDVFSETIEWVRHRTSHEVAQTIGRTFSCFYFSADIERGSSMGAPQ